VPVFACQDRPITGRAKRGTTSRPHVMSV
jgi:hypothetical protein